MLHYFAARLPRRDGGERCPRSCARSRDAGAIRDQSVPGRSRRDHRRLPRGDERCTTRVTARRPVAEAAIAACGREQRRTSRCGAASRSPGLLTGDESAQRRAPRRRCAHRLRRGARRRPRRSTPAGAARRSRRCSTDIGARAPIEEHEDCGFIYYGRHFRSGRRIGARRCSGPRSCRTSIGVDPHAAGRQRHVGRRHHREREGRGATRPEGRRHVDPRGQAAIPLVAHWLDGEPHRRRQSRSWPRSRTATARSSIDGKPVATGVLAVADSWACTNPSVGRGCQHRRDARGRAARSAARRARPIPIELARGWHERDDGDRRAVVPRHARVRPAPPGRDRRRDRGRGRTSPTIPSTR